MNNATNKKVHEFIDGTYRLPLPNLNETKTTLILQGVSVVF